MKAITSITAAAVLAATLAVPSQADARHRGWGWGPGIVGGLAAGALLGAFAAPRYYAYAPAPYYYRPRPYYAYAPRPYYSYGPRFTYVGGPYARYRDCFRRRVWTPYGWRLRRVCY